MESDKTTIIDNETQDISVNSEIVEDNSFEISDEAKQQSRKFFKFGQKPKREKRKFESFEIVKTFTPKEKNKTSSDFDKILEISNSGNVDESVITTASTTKQQKVKMKLRPRGKLILIAISAVIILLSSLCISNAVKINRLNSDITNVSQQIDIEDLKIDTAIKKLGSLTDEAKSDDTALRLELDKCTDFNEVELYERQTQTKPNAKSNWFDKFCNFISKIFGG